MNISNKNSSYSYTTDHAHHHFTSDGCFNNHVKIKTTKTTKKLHWASTTVSALVQLP